jgi:hypothetical protein
MPAFALSLLLFASAPPPGPAKDATVAPELLSRLAEQADLLSKIYIDGGFTIHSVIENLDRDGKPTSTTEVVTRVRFEGGVEHDEIVSRIEDGKDVTAKAERKHKHSDARIVSPFETAQQAKYRFTDKGADTDDPALEHIAYEPVHAGDDTYVGEAVVDPATAMVVRHVCRPSKLPRLVDRLSIVLDLGLLTDAGPTPSALHVAGEGGILFYRKRMKIESTFDEYQVPKALPTASGRPD